VAVDALLLSVRTTAVTMAILLLVGTPAAYVLARADFRGSRVINTLIDIPVVLPPSAAGIALLLAFGRLGLVGQYLNVFGITLSFTTAAVVMAEVFVAATGEDSSGSQCLWPSQRSSQGHSRPGRGRSESSVRRSSSPVASGALHRPSR
jgi:ABC-type spermidine/putrescine transport system permease subunit II